MCTTLNSKMITAICRKGKYGCDGLFGVLGIWSEDRIMIDEGNWYGLLHTSLWILWSEMRIESIFSFPSFEEVIEKTQKNILKNLLQKVPFLFWYDHTIIDFLHISMCVRIMRHRVKLRKLGRRRERLRRRVPLLIVLLNVTRPYGS